MGASAVTVLPKVELFTPVMPLWAARSARSFPWERALWSMQSAKPEPALSGQVAEFAKWLLLLGRPT